MESETVDKGGPLYSLFGVMTSVVTFIFPNLGFLVLNLFALSVTSSIAWLFSLKYYWNQSQHNENHSM